jgi:hypothetical protein
LQAQEVFLLGETDNSFDGRYFGASQASDIVGRIDPVLLVGDTLGRKDRMIDQTSRVSSSADR